MLYQMKQSPMKSFKKCKDPIAFILGIYPTSNLGAVRNLGRNNVPLIVLDVKKHQAAFYSKYAKGFVCPHPKFNEEKYIDFLVDIGNQLSTEGVLIPTGDTETLALLRHRDRLKKYYYFTMASFEKVNLFINKRQFYQYLEKQGISHAKTFFPKNENDIENASAELSFPCIIKPVYPTYFRFDFDTKVFVATSAQHLQSLYRNVHERHHEVMVQEIIPGDASAMFGFNAYYDKCGTPHGIFMYRRIREWPLGFGNGCYIQHVHEPILEQITTPLVRKINYYGIVDAEFKRDPRDGLFKFIELNPRVWMQNSFPSRYGCNLPYLAYLDAIGKPLPETPKSTIKQTIKWVYFLEDMQSVRAQIRNGSIRLRSILPAYSLRNEHAIFAWDDPLPFFILGCRSISTLGTTFLHPST